MRSVKRSRVIVVMLLVLALCGTAAAIPENPCAITGMFGLTKTDTVRINILNAGDEKGIFIPCSAIFNSDGKILAEFEGGEPLSLGKAQHVDFNLPNLPDGERMQIRVQVELEGANEKVFTSGEYIVTVELFDSDSGKTQTLIEVVPQ